jgi:hypothetical protein
LCNTCNQEKCVGYGFKSAGVHSPSYGNKELRYRTNKSAYVKSVIAKKKYIKKKEEFIDKNYACLLLNQL